MRIAINGFGRIGKSFLRAVYEKNLEKEIEIVHINSTVEIETDCHLLNFDSTNGKFIFDTRFEKNELGQSFLIIKNDKIKFSSFRNPENLNWKNIDIVIDCSGAFLTKEKASIHLEKGAKKVILSGPVKENDIKTIIYQVNDDIIEKQDNILSVGSCTTNCLAPLVKSLHDAFVIQNGFATTVHAYTNDQNLIDASHKDLRRARSACMSIIPTTSGVASAIGQVFPDLKNKIGGSSMRVPVSNVSIVDFKFTTQKTITINSINEVFRKSSIEMNKVLSYSNLPLVSVDYLKNEYSSVVDMLETNVSGSNFGRVCSWYDNEWSFVFRMIDLVLLLNKFI